MEALCDEAFAFVDEHAHNSRLLSFVDDLLDFVAILRSGVVGNFDVSWGTLLKIAAVIAYLICPFDLVADGIPGIGFVDDFAVWACQFKTNAEVLQRFRSKRGVKSSAR